MSPQDRNAKRITIIRNKIRAGTLSRADGERQIAKIEAAGPAIVARYEDAIGKEHTEPAKDWDDALKIEARRKVEVERGDFTAPALMDTTLVQILDFYLTQKMTKKVDGAKKRRTSFKNVRALRDHALRLLGPRLTIRTLDRDPNIMAWHLRLLDDDEAKPAHRSYGQVDFKSQGTTLNYVIMLTAAIAFWKKKNRVAALVNPMDCLDRPWKKGKRKKQISYTAHVKLVDTSRSVDIETGLIFPAWVPVYFEAGWETGWRAGEIQDWAWERMTLEPPGLYLPPPDDEFPWIRTLIEKQHESDPVYEDKPISRRLGEILRAMPAPQKERGRIIPLKRTMTDRIVRRVLNQAGFPDLKFHDYRYSFRNRAKMLDGLPKGLAEHYQGWESEQMPDRYTIHQRRELELVLRKMENR